MDTNVGSGDRGMTSLLSGERVAKGDGRIEACGELDELSSVLGALGASLGAKRGALAADLLSAQAELLHIGAWVGVSPDSAAARALPPLTPAPLASLEAAMARMEAELPALTSFILPGGHPSAAWAHVARTVCRRAERRVTALPLGPAAATILPYLNRLSSFLFVAARSCNQANGVLDIPWGT
jgi:cob(I)alamin adenosyltransferase